MTKKAKVKKQKAKRKEDFFEKAHPFFLIFAFSLLLSLFGACVPVPPEMMPQAPGTTSSTAAVYPDIDPGGTSITTLHFVLKGYNENDLRPISASAEDIYNKIGNDTGIYSFLAGQTYTLVVYKDQNEYTTKTHQPTWSRAVAAGNAIYTYVGPDLDADLAHQITHLVFNSYLGDKITPLRWLVEGIAMHEELARMSNADLSVYQTSQASQLRAQRMPFTQMTFFVPATEEHRRTDVWYQQVESVVTFLLKQGSNLSFGALLTSLRNGADMDRALSDNYPGRYRSLADLEQSWQTTI